MGQKRRSPRGAGNVAQAGGLSAWEVYRRATLDEVSNVVDASDLFADRRWDPARFVKSGGQDPLVYLVYRDQDSVAPLSLLPEDVARFLVRVINTARHYVPAVRRVTSVLWTAADAIELRYAPDAAGAPDVVEHPKRFEMLERGVVLLVTILPEPAGSTPQEVA